MVFPAPGEACYPGDVPPVSLPGWGIRYCNSNEMRKRFCGDNDNMSTMLRINRDKCGYCGTCVAVCPEDALELIDAYLSLERDCIACGICARACPLGALEVVHEE